MTALKNLLSRRNVKALPPIIFFAGAYAKNILLQCFFAGDDHYVPSAIADGRELFFGLFFGFFALCLLFSFALLFRSRKGALIYTSILSGLFTVFCVFDVCYYRAFPEMFSFWMADMAGEAAADGYLSFEVVTGLFSGWDVLFFLDGLIVGAAALALLIARRARGEKKGAAAPSAPEEPTAKDGGAKAKKAKAGAEKAKAGAEKAKAKKANTKKGNAIKAKAKKEKERFEKTPLIRRIAASRPARFAVVFGVCLAVFLALPALRLFGAAENAFYDLYDPPFRKSFAFHFTPVGWHLYDAVSGLAARVSSGEDPATPTNAVDPTPTPTDETTNDADDPGAQQKITDREKQQIDDFYGFRAALESATPLTGRYAGKNLLLLQVESLENVMLFEKVNGREITPTLNALLRDDASTLFFTGLHDQVKSGNSSDCDYMINTGLLPTSDVFFKKHLDVKMPNIPDLLRSRGYNALHINGSGAHCVWDYRTAYRDVFSFNTDENDPDCAFFLLQGKKEERLNNYMSDQQILAFVEEKLKTLDADKPWFVHTILCSSHMPFTGIYKLPEEELLFPVAEEDRDNKTYAYINAVHYTDAQIGAFLERAGAAGLLDNTLVLIYGDHRGLHKYYPADAKDTASAHEEFAFVEKESDATITFMIYDPSGTLPRTTCDTYGGQIDIMPTTLDLLGIPYADYAYAMGRNLLAGQRNFTVLPSGKVLTTGLASSEENLIVYRMYQTADLIVKTGYFGNYKP